jgi:hypothetical protein
VAQLRIPDLGQGAPHGFAGPFLGEIGGGRVDELGQPVFAGDGRDLG